MSLRQSPSIIRNGLLFYYDMGNTKKSWKGKPTTNEFVSSITDTYGGVNASTLLPGTLDAFGGTSPVTRKVGKIRLGNSSGVDIGTLYYGNTYTFSIYLRKAPDFTSSNGGEFDIVDQSSIGKWVDSEPMSGSLASNMTYEWRRFSVSSVHTNSASYHFVDIGQYLDTAFIYEWCCPQIEQSAFPTPYIPFSTTHQSRSNTQAILDLTGQNTITANNLQYNSNNTFELTGADGSNVSISNIDLRTDFTLEGWFYLDALGGGFFGHGITDIQQGLHITVGTNYTRFGMYGNDTDFSLPHATGEWAHYVFTYNHSTYEKKAYRNSISYTGSPVQAQTAYTASPGVLRVGQNYGSYSAAGINGKAGTVKMYNRVLSAEEVKQNFNALRGRYGL